MRLPNYLQIVPSGVWHFRQRVPADLLHIFKQRFFKHSLRTRDVLIAQRLALALADQYAHVVRRARGMHVSGKGAPSVQDIIRQAANRSDYKLTRRPDGTVEIEAEGQTDHKLAMNAIERIGVMAREPSIQ